MQLTLLKSKLLRAEVTETRRDYEGSIAIDKALMEQAALHLYERVLVGNITTGTRFETYAIEAPSGSGTISLNGAAAHMGKIGELLVIMSFAQIDASEAKEWQPSVLVLSDHNQCVSSARNYVPEHPNPIEP